MKIIVEQKDDDRVIGLARALGQGVVLWNEQVASCIEVVNHVQPDVFLTFQAGIIPYLKNELPELKVVLANETHPDADLQIDLTEYLADQNKFGGGTIQPRFLCQGVILDSAENKVVGKLGAGALVRWFGHYDTDSPYYLGMLAEDEYRDAIASAKYLLAFSRRYINAAGANGCVPILVHEVGVERALEIMKKNETTDLTEYATKTYDHFAARLLEELA